MAHPQKENGYTPIANEIMEALVRTRINGEARQVLDHILRQTYGWSKKEDVISLSQFSKATGMKKTAVQRSIKKLLTMNVILQKEYGLGKKYCLIKDFDLWKPYPKRSRVPQKDSKGTPKGGKRVPQKVVYKSNKAIIQNKDHVASKDAPMIVALIDAFEPVNTAFKKWYARPPQRDAASRLIAEHGLEQLQRVIKLLPISNQTPYFPTITTPLELEDRWSKLESAWKRKRNEQLTGKNGLA